MEHTLSTCGCQNVFLSKVHPTHVYLDLKPSPCCFTCCECASHRRHEYISDVVFKNEFHAAIRNAIGCTGLPIDSVIVQCAPPRDGYISLGVSVDVLKAGIESAKYILAQINPNMPWTVGDSLIPVSSIDAFVEHEEPLCECGYHD